MAIESAAAAKASTNQRSVGDYLPEPVYEALREAAFHERCKIHDIVMEGIGLALRKRGYPALDDLKAGKKR
jgi:hypothetical protein